MRRAVGAWALASAGGRIGAGWGSTWRRAARPRDLDVKWRRPGLARSMRTEIGDLFFFEARVMSASRGWAVGGLDWRAPIFF